MNALIESGDHESCTFSLVVRVKIVRTAGNDIFWPVKKCCFERRPVLAYRSCTLPLTVFQCSEVRIVMLVHTAQVQCAEESRDPKRKRHQKLRGCQGVRKLQRLCVWLQVRWREQEHELIRRISKSERKSKRVIYFVFAAVFVYCSTKSSIW